MRSRQDSGGLVWGIVLLVVGVVFLLNNFGYLPFLILRTFGTCPQTSAEQRC